MTDATITDPLEEIRAEAREEFDLDAMLTGRPMRKAEQFTIFTDEVAAEELGWNDPLRDRITGAVIGHDRRGVLGKIAELREKNEDGKNDPEILALLDEAEALKERLVRSGIALDLIAVPRLVKKDARRKARAELGITGKGIPEAQQQDFDEEFYIQILALSLVSFTPAATGQTIRDVTINHARSFLTKSPDSEIARLTNKLRDLHFATVISESAVEDADF